MSNDPASILFPNEGRSAATPDWFSARRSEAELRLQGQHGAKDAASALFPNEKPADPAAPPAATKAPDALFSDAAPDLHEREISNVLTPLADDARLSGDTERAAELEAATASLAGEFAKAGTDPGTVAEVMQLAKEALGDTVTGPVEPERLAEMEAQAHSWIAEAGITDAELSAARRMIDDLEAVTPGIKAYLGDTGLGNNPKMIERAVREARRRGYR